VSAVDRDRAGLTGAPFRLDRSHAKFMGVCGGIANHFGWDANLVRVAWVLATLLGFGSLILVYLAIGLIVD
jgi:phage shock protein PspC (stress-responsive transcriptional regulator)